MGNFFFPQLTTGSLAQYPIQKTRIYRSVTNLLPDGTLIMDPDPAATILNWKLSYSGLSGSEVQQLQQLFQACSGPLRAFTFIDPTDNMLTSAADLTTAAWQNSGLVTITPGANDPAGGNGATILINTSQTAQQITQLLNVPANYQYCFSVYVTSTAPATFGLLRQGTNTNVLDQLPIGPGWIRAITSGNLNDSSTTLTVGIELQPGQQLTVFGPQLEGQIAPSALRLTGDTGGVYADAHWVQEELAIAATAPNVFSTIFSIEAIL